MEIVPLRSLSNDGDVSFLPGWLSSIPPSPPLLGICLFSISPFYLPRRRYPLARVDSPARKQATQI